MGIWIRHKGNRTCFETEFPADRPGSRRAKAVVQITWCSLLGLCPLPLSWAPVPCFQPAARLPVSHSDLSAPCFAKLLLFPQLDQVPSLLKSGHVYNSNLRGFWLPLALIVPLLGGWCTAKAARWVFCPVAATDHPLGKQLITPVSWASWDVNSPSEELHLMIPVGCIYGGWTSLCPTALRAKPSSADTAKCSRGCGFKLWYYKGLMAWLCEKKLQV